MPNQQDKLHNIRHTLAHILAHAVLNLYGGKVKFGIGPVIDTGFYYDFDLPEPIAWQDLSKIEEEMRKLISQDLKMEKVELSPAELKKHFKGQPYKQELIKELDKSEITFYQIGDFLDLCRGGHVESTKQIPADAFKLTHLAGAYWRGSEKNPMLTRIYAAAFATSKELSDHSAWLEEAKKRDHRKLGPQLDLFLFHETAPGMPYWLPKGLVVLNELIQFWRKEHGKRGYQEISTPLVNKKELWKISGHWDNFKENMFIMDMGENEVYGVKPMNCPNAMIVFGSKIRSYKDLPLRLSDTDLIHRYEVSGALEGLLRARAFRQDDSHNFVTEEQIEQEYQAILEIAEKFYGIFQLEYYYRLGTRPKKFLGDAATWDKAETALKRVLNKKVGKGNYQILEEEGAFYGPKIDIIMTDRFGRQWQMGTKWQMGTIQLDFQLPRRFNLSYIDAHGQKKTPVVIHRVIYGSLERFIGILIEHFGGAFPVWLAPVQVIILPISDEVNKYAEKILSECRIQNAEFRIELDDRNETIGKKIREAEQQKIPYMLIVGKKELEQKNVSVRQRGEKDLGKMKLDEFISKISAEIQSKSL